MFELKSSTRRAQELLHEGLALLKFGDQRGLIKIRRAPFLANFRAERINLSIMAAANDGEILRFSELAQSARSRGDSDGWEYNLWRCADAYPLHRDFAIQYAEALFEKRKFPDAESMYRNGIALGGPATECYSKVKACLNYQGVPDGPFDRKIVPFLLSEFDAFALPDHQSFPDIYTISSFTHIFLGMIDPGLPIRLLLQRSSWDVPSLLDAVFALPEFRFKNHEFFVVLKSRLNEGKIL